MAVDRSRRSCVLCDAGFSGRTFLCRTCADRYRDRPVPVAVRQQFYEAVDRAYPDYSNTYGHYNDAQGLLSYARWLPRQSRILEIGAGGGFTLIALRDLGFRRTVGLDLTATTLEAMRQRLDGTPLVAADAEELPFADGSFDAVLSSDLIEHLPNLDRHLASVARVLRPGGCYLIKTPNRLMAEAYYRARGLYDAYFWHPSMSSPGELRTRLERHGFDCEFLLTPHLTEAQTRKIPIRQLRPIASRIPVGWLPPLVRPHLEVVARKVLGARDGAR